MGFAGKNSGVGCHFLCRGIFPTQGWNPYLQHCRQIYYSWASREAQEIYKVTSKRHESNCWGIWVEGEADPPTGDLSRVGVDPRGSEQSGKRPPWVWAEWEAAPVGLRPRDRTHLHLNPSHSHLLCNLGWVSKSTKVWALSAASEPCFLNSKGSEWAQRKAAAYQILQPCTVKSRFLKLRVMRSFWTKGDAKQKQARWLERIQSRTRIRGC